MRDPPRRTHLTRHKLAQTSGPSHPVERARSPSKAGPATPAERTQAPNKAGPATPAEPAQPRQQSGSASRLATTSHVQACTGTCERTRSRARDLVAPPWCIRSAITHQTHHRPATRSARPSGPSHPSKARPATPAERVSQPLATTSHVHVCPGTSERTRSRARDLVAPTWCIRSAITHQTHHRPATRSARPSEPSHPSKARPATPAERVNQPGWPRPATSRQARPDTSRHAQVRAG